MIDFDKATRDPTNSKMFLPVYDSCDHLHPSDASAAVTIGAGAHCLARWQPHSQCDPQAANRALELLGKNFGFFIDRAEIGSAGEFNHLTDEELAAELKSTVAGLVGGDLSPENLNAFIRGLVRSVEGWTCEPIDRTKP